MDQRGIRLLARMSRSLQINQLAHSLEQFMDAARIDCAAYGDSPSGALGRAVAVVTGGDVSIATRIQHALRMCEGDQFIVQWQEGDPASNDPDRREYSYAVNLAGGDQPTLELLWPVLFGSAGWQGVVRNADGRAAITFNRARMIRELAGRALRGPDRALADDAVVRSMQQWLPRDPAIIALVCVGGLLEHFRPLIQSVLSVRELKLPAVPRTLPPIAGAVAAKEASIEATVIIPAGVVAVGYDLIGEHLIRDRFFTPERDESGREPQQGRGQ